MIDGVRIVPLKRIPDERGVIMHMLRSDDPHFEKFGEIYFSGVLQGAVKAWHLHKAMALHYAVPSGMVKLVLFDDRPRSPTKGEVQEIFLGDPNYALVRIPPQVWNGFKGLAPGLSIVANCATLPHDPQEIERADPRDPRFPYDWGRKDG